MILACNKIIPPAEWEHDSELENKYGFTVCYYLFRNGI